MRRIPLLLLLATVPIASEDGLPVEKIYQAAHAPYAQMAQIYGLKQTFSEMPDGTYLGKITSTFEQDLDHPIFGKEEIENRVGKLGDVLRFVSTVRGSDDRIVRTEKALGFEGAQHPEFLVLTTIRTRVEGDRKQCVIALTGVSSVKAKDGSTSYSGQPIGLLSGCGMTPKLVAGPRDLPQSEYEDPGLAEEDRAIQFQMLILKHLGQRVVVREVDLESEGGHP